MDMSYFIPREMHYILSWLGKLEGGWLNKEGTIREGHPIVTRLIVDGEKIIDNARRSLNPTIIKQINTLFQLAGLKQRGEGSELPIGKESATICTALLWLEALSLLLGNGPKVFKPTAEQFDSMLQVSADIELESYQQPFPAMAVLIPKESRVSLANQIGYENWESTPSCVVITHRTRGEWVEIFIGQKFTNPSFENSYLITKNTAEKENQSVNTIEDGLNIWVEGGDKIIDTSKIGLGYGVDYDSLPENEKHDLRSYHFASLSGRAVVNLMLMLTHFGFKKGGPLHPNEYEKHRRPKAPPHLKIADFTTVEMVQDVVIRKIITHKQEGEPTGREVKPHWRRGHWRHQVYGVKRSLRKLIFIHPILIRPDRVVGDLIESKTSYQVKE